MLTHRLSLAREWQSYWSIHAMLTRRLSLAREWQSYWSIHAMLTRRQWLAHVWQSYWSIHAMLTRLQSARARQPHRQLAHARRLRPMDVHHHLRLRSEQAFFERLLYPRRRTRGGRQESLLQSLCE
jgi:hypothetical protein